MNPIEEGLAKSRFLAEYRRQACSMVRMRFPNLDPKEVEEKVFKLIRKRFQNPKFIWSNSSTGAAAEKGLLQFLDFLAGASGEERPTITGNGVFYRNRDVSSLMAVKLLDHLLSQRKKAKKAELELLNSDPARSRVYGKEQKVLKILANSYFGVLGEKRFVLYDYNVPESITYTGVQIITTTILAFEALLSGNFRFADMTDCLRYVEAASEVPEASNLARMAKGVPVSVDEVLDALVSRFDPEYAKASRGIDYDPAVHLRAVLEALPEEKLLALRYRNSLYDFLSLPLNLKLVRKAVESDDPDASERLWGRIDRYVALYRWCQPDRYVRASTMRRESVLLSDTDSNFIHLEPFRKFVSETAGCGDVAAERAIPLMIEILQKFVSKVFAGFCKSCNVEDALAPRLLMKNEYLASRMLLTPNKRQYALRIVSREGTLLKEPKVEIKGLSIKKISTVRMARDCFHKILEAILCDEKVDLGKILSMFEELESEVRSSVSSGRCDYAIPANLNDPGSYKFPFRIPAVRGAVIWNALRLGPPINPPEKVKLLTMSKTKFEELKPIWGTPQFEAIKEAVFDNEEMSKYGFSVVALPKDTESIPKWMARLVDVDFVVSNTLSPGLILLESLGVKILNVLDKDFYSNIVSF